ncbi:thioredoxin [Sulfurifustis variabilis]|uniref:Thioredoxin n=1 Tax=Sulfurifustis variabilis TaxID=1675686 RepID=A0A1B4V5J8_9GAMM|nr:thioredoxin domain-containing protein [Sulfurifustis variabilis]BAU48813.1 thioredoxin [Sulfurifustis variabilis]
MSSPLIFDVTEADFERLVLEASHAALVAVDFWADWCPPCRALTPVLERVVPDYAGRVRLAKVEADENMRLAGRYRLRGFPTVILFGKGLEIDRFSSARAEGFVRAFLDARLAPA